VGGYMNKNVLIKVKGIQGSLVEDDAIEMITTGQYYEKNGKTYIKYEDTALDEDAVTSTTIKIDEAQVSVLRFGATNTQLIFEKNQEHFTPYETPFGVFEIFLRTTDIQFHREFDKVTLNVAYNIEVNHTGAIASNFQVEVTNQI
jgi:uncharacterized beta-barrel protein YwiB (DUF1934 family)